MEAKVPPKLSEALGTPDVFPFEQGRPENQLSPDALLNGYRISYERDFGVSEKGELELSLCGAEEQWDAARLLAYRRTVLQQLRLVYRAHKAKRKADVLYDVPLGPASLNTTIAYPQQHTVGEAARQQWAQDLGGSAPLEALAATVPHGFMRGKLFEMLADQAVALPRAVWFVQVAYLNRTKPETWDGGAKLPTRSLQCTEDLVAYLEQAAAAASAAQQAAQQATAGATASPGPDAAAVAAAGGSPGKAAAATAAAAAAAGRWQYLLRLAGALYSHGLLSTPALVGWLLGRAASLAASMQLQLVQLLSLTLRDVSLSPPLLRQVLDACLKVAASPPALQPPQQPLQAAAGAPPPSSPPAAAGRPAGSPGSGQQQQELRAAYAEVASTLVALAPAAFVPLDPPTLTALGSLVEEAGGGEGGEGRVHSAGAAAAEELLREVGTLQRRLASAVNPRVLRLPDCKALQLLDAHLASCDPAAAHAELWSALLPPAPSQHDTQQAQRELVQLVCAWAVARPVLQMAAALCGDAAGGEAAGGQSESSNGSEGSGARHSGLQPGRALLALGILRQHIQSVGQHQQQQQGQQQGQQLSPAAQRPPGSAAAQAGPPERDVAAVAAAIPQQAHDAMQQALFSWLDAVALGCSSAEGGVGDSQSAPPAGQAGPAAPSPAPSPVGRAYAARVQEWAVLLLDSGLLDPGYYLRSLLASGALPAGKARSRCARAAFHLELLQDLHPSLAPEQPAVPVAPQQPRSPTPSSGPPHAGSKRKLDSEEPPGAEAGGGGSATARPPPSQPAPPAKQRRPSAAVAGGPAVAAGGGGGAAAAAAAAELGTPACSPAVGPRRQPSPEGTGLDETAGAEPGRQPQDTAAAYAALRHAVLQEYGAWLGRQQAAAGAGAGLGRAPSWVRSASPDPDPSREWEPTRTASATTATTAQQAEDASGPLALRQLKSRLRHLLSLGPAGLPRGPARCPSPPLPAAGLQQQLWKDALADIGTLRAWQHRHMAAWLHGVVRQKLRTALSPLPGGGAAQLGAAPAAPALSPLWLMNVLSVLSACGGHKEAVDVLCELLAALLRAVATAAASAGSASPGQPPATQLSQRVWAASDRFWRQTGLAPTLLLRLVSAHHRQLAALGRVPRMLRMLTAGLWALVPPASPQRQAQAAGGRPQDPRVQQPQHGAAARQQAQQEVLASCQAQLTLAAELLALYGGPVAATSSGAAAARGPGSTAGRAGTPGPAAAACNAGVQGWVGEIERQHGTQHWLLAALRRLAVEAGASLGQPQPSGARPHLGAMGSSRAALAGQRGASPAGGPQRLEMIDVAGWMEPLAGQELQHAQRSGGAGAAESLLAEARQLVQGALASGTGGGSGQGSEVAQALPQGWAAGEQLAQWALAPASQAPGGDTARRVQERVAGAMLAIFQAHSVAAAAAPPAADAAGTEAPGAPCLPAYLQCLLRLLEWLERHGRQQLPPAFLPAAVATAARLTPSGGCGGGAVVPGAPCTLGTGAALLLGAVTHGAVSLPAALPAAKDGLVATLVADPCPLESLGTGEAWALAAFQGCLPQQAAVAALLGTLPPQQGEAGSAAAQQQGQQHTEAAPCIISPAVREACFNNPRQLYTALCQWAAARAKASSPLVQQQQLQPYPPLRAALHFLAGGSSGQGAAAAAGSAGVLNALLERAEPAALPLCWLVVRALLDEQVYLAALRRGESAQSALAAAAAQQPRQAGSSDNHATTEAEKDFTSRLLAELAVRPGSAAMLSVLCSEAGRGVSDYLLQQLDWVLQDADTLLGRQPLSAVLTRRGALINTAAFALPGPAFTATPPLQSRAAGASPDAGASGAGAAASPLPMGGPVGLQALPSLGTQRSGLSLAGISDTPQPGVPHSAFHQEQGFVEAALVCLAASSDARRRSFAQQLVQQLQRLADAVERLPLPHAAGAAQQEPHGQQQEHQQQPAAYGSPSLQRPMGTAGSGLQGQLSLPGEQAQSPQPVARQAWEAGSLAGVYRQDSSAAASSPPAVALGFGAAARGAAGGFGWRASNAGWGGGARGVQRGKASTDVVGAVAAVQVGVWLRLGTLLPLLPLVYADTTPDPNNSLRAQLLNAAARLLGSPYITATPADWPADAQRQAAAAAAEQAGEVLPARLLHMVHALAGSSWASWLQGGRQLRDMPAFEGARQLAAVIDGLPAAKRIKLAATGALPAALPPLAALPSTTPQGAAGSITPVAGGGSEAQSRDALQPPKAAPRADPWLLLPGGATGSDPQQQFRQATAGAAGGAAGAPLAPHWLLGAVRVRKRDLSYVSAGEADMA